MGLATTLHVRLNFADMQPLAEASPPPFAKPMSCVAAPSANDADDCDNAVVSGNQRFIKAPLCQLHSFFHLF